MATRKPKATVEAAAPAQGSYIDLMRQKQELDQRIADERAKIRPEVIAHIQASMVEYDIGIKDLVNANGNIRRKRRTRAEMDAARAAGEA